MGTLAVLQQLQGHQQSAPSQGGSSLDVLKQVASGADNSQPQRTQADTPGEQKNDVGATVIVPKDGEDVTQTMARAVQNAKNTPPEQRQAQIDAEMKTAPQKVAATLLATPAAGIGIPAMEAGGVEAVPFAAATVKALAPIAKKYGIKAMEGYGLHAGWELYQDLKKIFQ